ncbi:MAG: response regulator transcription factor [Lachnospiraceae bacterium]|nr:response regulator transcription factor [Lachnospiraceae bacterium]
MENPRLMVIEDEKPIAELLEYGLGREGFQVHCVQTAGAALAAAPQFSPQAILLDWMLPDMDGLELCRLLSAEYNVPIIMLTARADMEDKLKGLESGADDYITKPFDMREVVMRIRAVLRRFEKGNGTAKAGGGAAPITISEAERMVMRKGRLVELAPKEYELLLYLTRHPREALSRQRLLEEVWGYDFAGDTRTVDIHVQRLRKKLSLEGHLVTVFGVGYKYVP